MLYTGYESYRFLPNVVPKRDQMMDKNRFILRFTEEESLILDAGCIFVFCVPSFQRISVISQEDHLNEDF